MTALLILIMLVSKIALCMRDRGILLTKDEEMRHEAMRNFMEDMAIKFGRPRRGVERTSREDD
jgi:hypothetical protein